jgi:hypothetical protein
VLACHHACRRHIHLLHYQSTSVTHASFCNVSLLGVLDLLRVADFVIARELRVECDPFYGDKDLPDISARSPYVRQRRQPARAPAAAVEQGEKEPRSKVPWQRPPMQHQVPERCAESVPPSPPPPKCRCYCLWVAVAFLHDSYG